MKPSERDEFRAAMHAEFGCTPEVAMIAERLLVLARRHDELAVEACNTGSEEIDKQIAALDLRIYNLVKPIGATVKLGGDPRGYTVRVMLPKTDRYNSWGGRESGWGVPTR